MRFLVDQKHGLEQVAHFTEATTDWRRLPAGGQVPVRTPLAAPYFRWYCGCGVIGGKSSSKERSIAAHAAHVSREETAS